MAYLRTALPDLDFAAPVRRAPAAAPVLSTIERDVVQLSLTDPLSSTRPVTRRERFAAMLFGFRRVSSLSNPRLEALRRFAIHYRIERRHLAAAATAAATAAGIGIEQLDAVRYMIDAAHPLRRKVMRLTTLLALFAALVLGVAAAQFWLTDQLREPMIATILLGMAAVTIAPLFGNRAKARN